MLGKKDYSTIIILNTKSHQTQSYQINTWFLHHKKKLMMGGLGLILMFIAAASFLIYLNSSSQTEKNLLSAKISALETQLKGLKQNSSLQKIQNAESTLETLETYLKERGISGTQKSSYSESSDAVGGEFYPVNPKTDDYISYQAEKLEHLLEQVKNTPIGLPHQGEITSRFGVRGNPFSGDGAEQHNGLDFRGKIGEPIYATAEGKVTFAGVQNGYGNCVRIKHLSGYETLYAHLSKITVVENQKVQTNDKIGELGNTGRSSGPHLHYEVRKGDHFLNPEHFLYLK